MYEQGNQYLQGLQQRQIEAFGPNRRTTLAGLHYEDGLTVEQIAEEKDFSLTSIKNYMRKDGIETFTPHQEWFDHAHIVYDHLPAIWADPSLMHEMNPNQQYVLRLRFLTEGSKVPSLTEVGEEMGYTKQNVSLIEGQLLEKLEGLPTG